MLMLERAGIFAELYLASERLILSQKDLGRKDKAYLSSLLILDLLYCITAKPFLKNKFRPKNLSKDFCLKIGMPWNGCIPKGSTLEPLIWMYARYSLGQVPEQDDFLKKDIWLGDANFTVVDVGAYIGTFSLHFKELDNVRAYICIEPFQESFRVLSLNMGRNMGGKNLRLFNAACGAEAGLTGLASKGGGSTVHIQGGAYEDAEKGKVSVMALDSLLDDKEAGMMIKGRSILLKIDTEGFELEVLRGAGKFLGAIVSGYALIETEEGNAAEVEDIMRDRGFVLKKRFGDDLLFQRPTASARRKGLDKGF